MEGCAEDTGLCIGICFGVDGELRNVAILGEHIVDLQGGSARLGA